MPSFGDRLKALRKENHITQKQIAAFLNLDERTYRRYEADEIEPSAFKAASIAEYFSVSTDYVLGRTDDPTRY